MAHPLPFFIWQRVAGRCSAMQSHRALSLCLGEGECCCHSPFTAAGVPPRAPNTEEVKVESDSPCSSPGCASLSK